MSDQGGANEAGWQPDPHGRHEYRYWDGSAWTDQVSDGGVVSTDPPGDATTSMPVAAAAGPPSTEAPPYVAPTADKPKGKLPVGLLALVGLAVAAIVAALVIFLGGGDDGGGGSGTGDFAGSITDEDPFFVRTFDLEAGEALRVRVEGKGDLTPRLTLGIDEDLAQSQIFGFQGDEVDDLLSDFDFNYDELFSEAVDEDLSVDLSESLSEDFGEFQSQLSDAVPSLNGAGVPLFSVDGDQVESDTIGTAFLAPVSGTYSIIVSGHRSQGDFEGSIETTGPADDFDAFDADEDLDIAAYYESIEPHRDFLCDEDFWGEDPTELGFDLEQICDDDAFDELLSSDFSVDISDFSDDFSDLSDFSDDISDFSDFSDASDFTDDFSDFTDDVPDDVVDEEIGPIEVGDSIDGTIDSFTRDLYTFEGTGDRVTIEVIGTYAEGGLDPIVTVLDSAGNTIDSDDDGNPQGERNSLLEINLDAGETFTIAVSGFTDSSGDYTVSVS